MDIAASLVKDFKEPIRVTCGLCTGSPIAAGPTCPVENEYAILPDLDENQKFPWVEAVSSEGRENTEDGVEVECGTIDECRGCTQVPSDMKYYCDSREDRKWKVKTRKPSGDACPPRT
jgi:hypothetical protein